MGILELDCGNTWYYMSSDIPFAIPFSHLRTHFRESSRKELGNGGGVAPFLIMEIINKHGIGFCVTDERVTNVLQWERMILKCNITREHLLYLINEDFTHRRRSTSFETKETE